MNIYEAIGKGVVTGLIVSIPYMAFSYYLCKRLDRIILILDNHLQKSV